MRDKPFPDSIEQALTDPDEAAAYLDAVMELEDQAALLVALRHVTAATGTPDRPPAPRQTTGHTHATDRAFIRLPPDLAPPD